jgi:cell division protein FtsN
MEHKKLLWVIFSVVGFVLVVAVLGMVLFWPGGAEEEDGVLGALDTSEKEFDPIEWVREDEEYPGLEKPAEEAEDEEDVTIVYGENGEKTEAEGEAEEEPKDAEKDVSGTKDIEIEVYEPSKREDRPKERTEPAEKPAPEPREEKKAETVRIKEYWIQTGSYTDLYRAEEIKRELAERGVASVITSKTVNDTIFYRVRIGPYASSNEAEKFLGWIRGISGFESSYVSQVYTKKRLN